MERWLSLMPAAISKFKFENDRGTDDRDVIEALCVKQNSFKLRKHRQAGEHWRSTVVFKILESSCLLLQKQLQHRELMHAWEIWKALAPLKTPSSSEENIHRLRKHLSTRKRFLSWKHVAKAAKAKEDSLKKTKE